TILAWSGDQSGFRPRLTLLDSAGEGGDAGGVVHEGGPEGVPLPGRGGGPHPPGGPGAGAGGVRPGLNLPRPPGAPGGLRGGVALGRGDEATGTLHVVSSEVLHAVLTAAGDASGSLQADVVDEQGQVVARLVAAGGETQTATLFLPAGDYQVRLAH